MCSIFVSFKIDIPSSSNHKDKKDLDQISLQKVKKLKQVSPEEALSLYIINATEYLIDEKYDPCKAK